MPICKQWFSPCMVNLLSLDTKGRNEWFQNYDLDHTEDKWKNHLIHNINEVVPGFKYLVDFQWEFENNVGDLIFGSDYGIYLVIESSWLNMNTGPRAERSRIEAGINVKDRARRFKQLAIAKYGNDAIKIIGASYTNDTENGNIQFVDNQDKKIASIVKDAYNNEGKEYYQLSLFTN